MVPPHGDGSFGSIDLSQSSLKVDSASYCSPVVASHIIRN